MEQTEEFYTGNQVKSLLGITESTYRTTLRGYRQYIPSRKANKNKDLFTQEGMEIIGLIVRLRKMGYEESEIVSQLKKHPSYIKSQLRHSKSKEDSDMETILESEDMQKLVQEFVSRMSDTNKDIKNIRKTLDKRTENYRDEMLILEHRLNLNDSKTEQMVDSTKESITKLTKMMWKLESKVQEYENQTLFQRIKNVFKF